MRLSSWRFVSAAVALVFCNCTAALACNVGDIQCDAAGYRYVCECWTSEGCNYYPDGVCTNLLARNSAGQAQFMCTHSGSAVAHAACAPN
jgi:hypothetical protein